MRPLGTAMAGPFGTTGVARGRSFRSSPFRMNCHQMKNTVDATNSTADT